MLLPSTMAPLSGVPTSQALCIEICSRSAKPIVKQYGGAGVPAAIGVFVFVLILAGAIRFSVFGSVHLQLAAIRGHLVPTFSGTFPRIAAWFTPQPRSALVTPPNPNVRIAEGVDSMLLPLWSSFPLRVGRVLDRYGLRVHFRPQVNPQPPNYIVHEDLPAPSASLHAAHRQEINGQVSLLQPLPAVHSIERTKGEHYEPFAGEYQPAGGPSSCGPCSHLSTSLATSEYTGRTTR